MRIKAVWQVGTAGGGGNMFQLQQSDFEGGWVVLHVGIKAEDNAAGIHNLGTSWR